MRLDVLISARLQQVQRVAQLPQRQHPLLVDSGLASGLQFIRRGLGTLLRISRP